MQSLILARFGGEPPDDWDVIGWTLLIGGLLIMAVAIIGH